MYSTKEKNKIFAKGVFGLFFFLDVKYLSAYLFGQVFLSPRQGKKLPRSNQFQNILFYSLKVFYTSAPHAVTLLFHLLMNGN